MLTPSQIQFASDNNPRYFEDPALRAVMIAEGKIAFHTCYRLVHVPASFVVQLANRAITQDGPALAAFYRAVDHWLLCEILGAIGSHTIQ